MSGDRMVHVSEIEWTSDPLPRPERRDGADLLNLEHGELVEYVLDLREDLRAVRALLSEAFAMIVTKDTQSARSTRVTQELREELQRARKQAAA